MVNVMWMDNAEFMNKTSSITQWHCLHWSEEIGYTNVPELEGTI